VEIDFLRENEKI